MEKNQFRPAVDDACLPLLILPGDLISAAIYDSTLTLAVADSLGSGDASIYGAAQLGSSSATYNDQLNSSSPPAPINDLLDLLDSSVQQSLDSMLTQPKE